MQFPFSRSSPPRPPAWIRIARSVGCSTPPQGSARVLLALPALHAQPRVAQTALSMVSARRAQHARAPSDGAAPTVRSQPKSPTTSTTSVWRTATTTEFARLGDACAFLATLVHRVQTTTPAQVAPSPAAAVVFAQRAANACAIKSMTGRIVDGPNP